MIVCSLNNCQAYFEKQKGLTLHLPAPDHLEAYLTSSAISPNIYVYIMK